MSLCFADLLMRGQHWIKDSVVCIPAQTVDYFSQGAVYRFLRVSRSSADVVQGHGCTEQTECRKKHCVCQVNSPCSFEKLSMISP